MNKFSAFLMILSLLSSCSSPKQKQPTEAADTTQNPADKEHVTSVPSLTDRFEVVSVETGWYDERAPRINIKLKNISGKAIDEFIKIKYQFIENDEIFDDGFKFLHSSSDVNWDNGLIKTLTCTSSYIYTLGGPMHKMRGKVCFEDNTPIWEGNISSKILY